MATCEHRFRYSDLENQKDAASLLGGEVIVSEVAYIEAGGVQPDRKMCRLAIAKMEPMPACPFPENDETNCPYLHEDPA